MKRVLLTILFCFMSLVISSATAFVLRCINIHRGWIMFGIASGILALGIATYMLLRKKNELKLVPFFINAVAMGVYLRSWYIFRGFDNPLWLIVSTAVGATSALLVFAAFLPIPKINDHYGLFRMSKVFVLGDK